MTGEPIRRGGLGPFLDCLGCAAQFLRQGAGDPLPDYAADVDAAADLLRLIIGGPRDEAERERLLSVMTAGAQPAEGAEIVSFAGYLPAEEAQRVREALWGPDGQLPAGVRVRDQRRDHLLAGVASLLDATRRLAVIARESGGDPGLMAEITARLRAADRSFLRATE